MLRIHHLSLSLALVGVAAADTCNGGVIEEGFDYPGNDVSSVGNITTAAECCAACTADAACSYWTLWVSGKQCFKKSSAAGRTAYADHISGGTAAPTPAPLPGACSSDLDCSLNGVCTSGACKCDKPWSGDACETLNFKPVSFPQGYGMVPNTTSWGGGVIYDEASSTHHMYVSRMTNNCTLATWGKSSRIDHAVSHSGPEGPYAFADVAVNTWAHNAAPIKLHDGTFAIIHIGTGEGGPDGGPNCTKSESSFEAPPTRAEVAARVAADAAIAAAPNGGSTIHVSPSLDGPWTPLANDLGGCNNPAPWVLPNGTIFVGCGGAFRRAEHIAGPYTTVASFPTGGGPAGHYEDPQIYTDKRGNFHCFYHVYTTNLPPTQCVDSTVSAHSFSEDGFTWHISKTAPYSTQVPLTTGETITVATRERPKPFFNAEGVMTHLLNGVCGSGNCTDSTTGCVDCKYNHWDYTLVAPLDV